MNGLKKWIPENLKFPFWWIFKSPQRKFGIAGFYRDCLGIFRFLVHQLPLKQKPKTLSICVGIYNRTEIFSQHFLPSLAKCAHQELIELSIFDCGSEDLSDLKSTIKSQFKGKLVFHSMKVPFARSYAFNRAVKQSTHELIFVCDADFSIPPNIVQLCSSYTSNGSFWFPIVFYLYKNKPDYFSIKHGEWMLWGGKGIFSSSRESFDKSGGLDESFKTWGGEDEEFWLRCHQLGFVVIRNKEKGLLHHWHPSLNIKYKLLENIADSGIL